MKKSDLIPNRHIIQVKGKGSLFNHGEYYLVTREMGDHGDIYLVNENGFNILDHVYDENLDCISSEDYLQFGVVAVYEIIHFIFLDLERLVKNCSINVFMKEFE